MPLGFLKSFVSKFTSRPVDWDELEEALRGQLNSLIHPVTSGPLVRAGSIALTGGHPFLTSLHPPSLFPATPRTKPGLETLAERGKASALSLNPLTESVFGYHPGPKAGGAPPNRVLRMAVDLVAPRLVGQVTDPDARADRLRSLRGPR